VTAREIDRVTIAEALELTALVARNSLNATAASPRGGFASGSKSTKGRLSKMSRCCSRTCDLF
jgi:hypothetical protein